MQKNYWRYFMFGFIGASVLFSAGFLLGYGCAARGFEGCGRAYKERVESLEDGLERIAGGVGRTESCIKNTRQAIDAGRKEIAASRTIVGNIECGIDRIDERNKGTAESLTGIEKSCERIEQTLSSIEKD